MQKIITFLSKLDYVVALGCIAWGLYYSDYWIVLAGVMGLFLAKLNLASRVQKRLEKYLVKKKSTEDHSALLAEHEKMYETSILVEKKEAVDFSKIPDIQYTNVHAGQSKHNLILKPRALALTADNSSKIC